MRQGMSSVRRQRRREGLLRLAKRTLWQAYYNFDKDNGWMIAGHIAYMGLFALFPFLIFLVALAGFLGQGAAADTSVELGLELLPTDVASALKPAIDEVRQAPHAGLMTFGIMVTLWASSSGLEALRHALNLAYDVADRRPSGAPASRACCSPSWPRSWSSSSWCCWW